MNIKRKKIFITLFSIFTFLFVVLSIIALYILLSFIGLSIIDFKSPVLNNSIVKIVIFAFCMVSIPFLFSEINGALDERMFRVALSRNGSLDLNCDYGLFNESIINSLIGEYLSTHNTLCFMSHNDYLQFMKNYAALYLLNRNAKIMGFDGIDNCLLLETLFSEQELLILSDDFIEQKCVARKEFLVENEDRFQSIIVETLNNLPVYLQNFYEIPEVNDVMNQVVLFRLYNRCGTLLYLNEFDAISFNIKDEFTFCLFDYFHSKMQSYVDKKALSFYENHFTTDVNFVFYKKQLLDHFSDYFIMPDFNSITFPATLLDYYSLLDMSIRRAFSGFDDLEISMIETSDDSIKRSLKKEKCIALIDSYNDFIVLFFENYKEKIAFFNPSFVFDEGDAKNKLFVLLMQTDLTFCDDTFSQSFIVFSLYKILAIYSSSGFILLDENDSLLI